MNSKVGSGRVGWGERIRTSDWLIQNQLPYHLATPQRSFRVYRTTRGTPVCRRDRRHILDRDGSARVAPLSGTAVSLLGVWREYGRLRDQRARPAGESRP